MYVRVKAVMICIGAIDNVHRVGTLRFTFDLFAKLAMTKPLTRRRVL